MSRFVGLVREAIKRRIDPWRCATGNIADTQTGYIADTLDERFVARCMSTLRAEPRRFSSLSEIRTVRFSDNQPMTDYPWLETRSAGWLDTEEDLRAGAVVNSYCLVE